MIEDATRWELQENSRWLRWILFAGAIGMAVLLYQELAADESDFVKAACIALGVLLLGFSGFVVRERRIVVEPARSTIEIHTRGLRSESHDSIAFSELRRIQIVETPTTREDADGRTRPDTDWFVVLVLAERSVALNANPCGSAEQARSLATEVARRTGIPLDEDRDRSIEVLLQQGRKIEAIAAVARQQGLSLSDATTEIDRRRALAKPPIG